MNRPVTRSMTRRGIKRERSEDDTKPAPEKIRLEHPDELDQAALEARLVEVRRREFLLRQRTNHVAFREAAVARREHDLAMQEYFRVMGREFNPFL